MKKKQTLLLMLPIVILVWGFVIYQLFGSFFSSPNYAKELPKIAINVSEIKKDTFFIVADYRDPFLGKKSRIRKVQNSFSTSVNQNNTSKRIAKTTQTEKQWPNLIYKGMIKNNNSEKKVGILSVNGKEYLIREKDVVGEVTVLQIKKNTVNIRFQKESRTITK